MTESRNHGVSAWHVAENAYGEAKWRGWKYEEAAKTYLNEKISYETSQWRGWRNGIWHPGENVWRENDLAWNM